ncbi:flagellar hook-length control protein FliK [Undibacterium oligocarboniphilum]|nr:flagellar hook-length control protein FliK [Undibacterium oligocarboniphilum]
MQSVNIVNVSSSVNNPGQTTKNSSGNNTDGAFNVLLQKEISGNQPANNLPTPPAANQPAKNTSTEEKNDSLQKADAPASPVTNSISETNQAQVKKKTKTDQDDDNSAGGVQKDSKPDQLIQFFGALSALPKADNAKTVTDKKQVSNNVDAAATGSIAPHSLPPSSDAGALQVASLLHSDAITTDLKKTSTTDHLPREFVTSESGIENIREKKDIGKKDFAIQSDVSQSTVTTADPKLQKTETKGEPAIAISLTKDNVNLKSGDSAVSFADHLTLKQTEEKSNTAITAPLYLQQTNAIQTATMTGIVGSNQITPNLNSPLWDKAVGQKVIWMVGESMQSAELTLNPPDLGPLQIVLNVTNDQANATFISAHPDVRDALEASLPKLQQMMNDAGVQLSNFSVQSGAANQDQTGREYRSQSSHQSNGAEHRNTSATDNETIQTTAIRMVTRLGEVDTFA